MAKLKIKKGDRVVVLAGKDKGKKGEVLKVLPQESRVIVNGVNMIKRHQKQSAAQEGGIISKEAPIHVSVGSSRARCSISSSLPASSGSSDGRRPSASPRSPIAIR